MPKPTVRKIQRFEKRLFIVCEGSRDKSEDAYLSGFIRTCRLPATVKVQVVDTRSNTGKELVKIAADLIEGPDDEAWVVYDKDGYTKHPETFHLARTKGVNIAFSAVSFEVWILLHFNYTTRAFPKSADVIHYLKHDCSFEYEKNRKNMFHAIKSAGGSLKEALSGAKKLQVAAKSASPDSPIYQFDSYTDIDRLIETIQDMVV